MSEELKIGDYVEHCSLMPGVLMAIDGDEVEIRLLKDVDYNGKDFSCCSISNCGVRKLTYEQVKMALFLGNEKLGDIYQSVDGDDDSQLKYDALVKDIYLKQIEK